jgi:hypothetical protein
VPSVFPNPPEGSYLGARLLKTSLRVEYRTGTFWLNVLLFPVVGSTGAPNGMPRKCERPIKILTPRPLAILLLPE